jgi:hypothetical protein
MALDISTAVAAISTVEAALVSLALWHKIVRERECADLVRLDGWLAAVPEAPSTLSAIADRDDPLRPRGYIGQHTAQAVIRRRALEEPTHAFDLIIAHSWSADWRCTSCQTGRDGERTHQSCAGCSCPCSLTPAETATT